MNKNSKGIVHFFLLLVVALIAFAGIGYYAYKNGQININPSQRQTTAPKPKIDLSRTCNNNDIYESLLNLSFQCLPDYVVKDSTEALNITPLETKDNQYLSYYHSLYVTTTKSMDRDNIKRIEEYLKLQVGENYIDPQFENIDPEVPDNIKNSLTRIENQQIDNNTAYVFEDQYPYEGPPLLIYIFPYEDYNYFIKLSSSGLSKIKEPTTKDIQIYNDLNQILSTFQFTN